MKCLINRQCMIIRNFGGLALLLMLIIPLIMVNQGVFLLDNENSQNFSFPTKNITSEGEMTSSKVVDLSSAQIEEITIVTPEETNYLQPMSGYYAGTYGFENELYNTFGLDIDFLDEYYTSHPATSSYVFFATRDSRPIPDHKNVLNLVDAQSGGWCWGVHNFDSPPTAGTVEFFLRVTGTAGTHYFELRTANDLPAIEMRITFSGSMLQYFDGSVWQDIGVLIEDQWFHHSITFDCEAGVNGQFSWIISYENGTEFDRVENIEFQNDLNTIDELYIGTTVADHQISTWWDAFGFSWDPNYSIGDNMQEGLLISYGTPTAFDWTGYSLDDGANVTINGNTTIPLPSPGSHTIQIFGSDILSNPYRSELRQFTVRFIDLVTPEETNYLQPMSGYYPASWGFENNLPGIEPNDWFLLPPDGSSFYRINAELDGHKDVLEVRKIGGTTLALVKKNFSTTVTAGTVEYWLQKDTDNLNDHSRMYLLNSTGGIFLTFYIQNGNLYYDDAWNGILLASGVMTQNTWHHIRIDFDLSQGGYQLHFDGTLFGSGYAFPFETNAGHAASFQLCSIYSGDYPDYASYLDAIGYSWDPGYAIGDNLKEGLLIGSTYDALTGGHYPGSYSFETDTIGSEPAGWTPDYDGNGYVEVVAELDGHKNVVHLRKDGGVVWTQINRSFIASVTTGQVEFWLYKDTDSGIDPTFIIMQNTFDPDGSLLCHFESTNFYYSYGALGDRVLVASNIYSANSWIHVSIDFDTAVGWQITIDGILYGDGYSLPFKNYATGGELYSTIFASLFSGGVSNYGAWIDAIGYSWDPDYNIGDNLFEKPFPINSYNTATPLDWVAYSLDGQANVTIQGNHTIPMPSPGIHTIQVVGFDYSGNFYQSDVILFEITSLNLPSISASNDISFDYGEVGYSILWSVSDPNPYNYTVYRNSSVYQEGTWTTTITCSLDGLEEGLHIFTCLIENVWGLQASDEVWVTILPDTTPPVISSPDDISFEEGSIGYSLTWSGSDQNLWWVTVYRNVTLIYDQVWTGNDIKISLDGLVGGAKYFYNCTLLDVSGNSVFDFVIVSVLRHVSDTTIPPTSTVTTTSTTTTQSSIAPSITSISGLTALAMLIFLPLIRLKRDSVRKKKK